MASTSSDISLNAVDTDAKVDDIDNDIAATISEPEVPKEESQTESVSASALIATEETAEPKAEASTTTKTSSIDTAKSLNESNNKIIKELDDETTKTFPQVVRTLVLELPYHAFVSAKLSHIVFASLLFPPHNLFF